MADLNDIIKGLIDTDAEVISKLKAKSNSFTTSINNLTTSVSSLTTSVTNVTSTANTNKSDISTLKTDVNTLKNNVTSLTTTVNTNKNDISTLKTNVTNVTSTANTNKRDISTLKTNVSSVTSTANTNKSDISTLKTNVSNISTSMGTLSSLQTSAKGNLVSAINEVFQSGSNAKTRLVNALTAKGETVSTSDSWDLLIGKVGELGKIISGSFTGRLECDPDSWMDIPLNLSYKPTNLFVKIGTIYSDSMYEHITNVLISDSATVSMAITGVETTLRISSVTARSFRLYFNSSTYTQAYLTNITWYAFLK